jgi:hypothetical protein
MNHHNRERRKKKDKERTYKLKKEAQARIEAKSLARANAEQLLLLLASLPDNNPEFRPALLSPDVLAFCASISDEPYYYEVPVVGLGEFKPNECIHNVEHFVKANGGSPLYGWKIRESPHYFSAEWHTIYVRADGELLDITPSDEPLTMFQVQNIRPTHVPVANINKAKSAIGEKMNQGYSRVFARIPKRPLPSFLTSDTSPS